jgi:hypothetical protein
MQELEGTLTLFMNRVLGQFWLKLAKSKARASKIWVERTGDFSLDICIRSRNILSLATPSQTAVFFSREDFDPVISLPCSEIVHLSWRIGSISRSSVLSLSLSFYITHPRGR